MKLIHFWKAEVCLCQELYDSQGVHISAVLFCISFSYMDSNSSIPTEFTRRNFTTVFFFLSIHPPGCPPSSSWDAHLCFLSGFPLWGECNSLGLVGTLKGWGSGPQSAARGEAALLMTQP